MEAVSGITFVPVAVAFLGSNQGGAVWLFRDCDTGYGNFCIYEGLGSVIRAGRLV